jgi:hypothetical protein
LNDILEKSLEPVSDHAYSLCYFSVDIRKIHAANSAARPGNGVFFNGAFVLMSPAARIRANLQPRAFGVSTPLLCRSGRRAAGLGSGAAVVEVPGRDHGPAEKLFIAGAVII